MDFGKLHNISRVDFSLAPDDPGNARILSPHAGEFRIHAGAPVWSRKEWAGSIYPKGARPDEFLRHYAKLMNGIELNVTHYRAPDSNFIERLKADTPDGFSFCPKVHQSLSHELQLQGPQAERLTRSFVETSLGLGKKLGPLLLQLPPVFEFSKARLRSLEQWLLWAKPARVAVEFRHPDWFSARKLRGEAFELLARMRASAVISDVAGRRDVSHGSLTVPWVFVRWVGNTAPDAPEPHPTDLSRLDDWVRKIALWKTQGLQEAHFYVHQPDDLRAPEGVRYFACAANLALGTSIPSVEGPLQAPPAQMTLF